MPSEVRIIVPCAGQCDLWLIKYTSAIDEPHFVMVDFGNIRNAWNWLEPGSIVEWLELQGCSSIDVAIVSHWDTDHIRYLKELVEAKFPIGTLICPERTGASRAANTMFNLVVQAKQDGDIGEIVVLVPGGTHLDGWGDGDLAFTVYGRLAAPPATNPTNHRSLLIVGEHAGGEHTGWRFGACGDAPQSLEHVIQAHVAMLDVWKISHHGSNYSSSPEFVAHVRPRAVFVMAGGRWGHPKTRILRRWANCQVTHGGPPCEVVSSYDLEIGDTAEIHHTQGAANHATTWYQLV